MFKKIIWAILEVATIGGGTYILVPAMLNEYSVDSEVAGSGAFLIVLGLLLRNWRMTLFIKEDKRENNNSTKSELQSKTANTLLIFALTFALFILNKKINDTNGNVDTTESSIQDLESKVSELDQLDHRLDNVESFEQRIEELETDSHRHY
jgi:hypothetical protein